VKELKEGIRRVFRDSLFSHLLAGVNSPFVG
jgi:hypothetical protein